MKTKQQNETLNYFDKFAGDWKEKALGNKDNQVNLKNFHSWIRWGEYKLLPDYTAWLFTKSYFTHQNFVSLKIIVLFLNADFQFRYNFKFQIN